MRAAEDLEMWGREVAREEISWYALRSALRIGHPNPLNRTHYIRLHLDYDERLPLLRQRIRLTSTAVIPFEETLRTHDNQDFLTLLRAQMPFSSTRWAAAGPDSTEEESSVLVFRLHNQRAQAAHTAGEHLAATTPPFC